MFYFPVKLTTPAYTFPEHPGPPGSKTSVTLTQFDVSVGFAKTPWKLLVESQIPWSPWITLLDDAFYPGHVDVLSTGAYRENPGTT